MAHCRLADAMANLDSRGFKAVHWVDVDIQALQRRVWDRRRTAGLKWHAENSGQAVHRQ